MNKLSIFILLTLALSIASAENILEKYLKNQELEQEYSSENSESINVALIGDYGSGNSNQKACAKHFNEICAQKKTKLVLGMGDNFYSPDGVSGLNDPAWHTKWADVYQNQSYLKGLTWYGTIGNHDYNGKGLFSEFEYKKHGWRIDDFFWAHTEQINGASIAFIHIDTSFLAYGINGQGNKPLMKGYFKELGWTNNQQMLDMIEELLIEYSSYDWKIVMGHHQIGKSCPHVGHTNLVVDLLHKHGVSAYFSGHAHQLSYSQYHDMGFVLSGAGSYPEGDSCSASRPMWAYTHTLGFMNVQIHKDYMDVVAHYQDSHTKQWTKHDLPAIKRRK